MNKTIVGCALANCVHTGGVQHFIALAESEGFRGDFLGPAVPAQALANYIKQNRPDWVAVGYRLTPENAVAAVKALQGELAGLDYRPRLLFGGTGPVARAVEKLGFFDKVFDGSEDPADCLAYLRGTSRGGSDVQLANKLPERILQKRPYPLLRHHFGLPSYDDTLAGIKTIADSGCLDIISLGPDQNTQQFFFDRAHADPRMDGAGGVPIKSEAEFAALKAASLSGNYPLMRCYSGTADVVRFAEMLARTIDNAWCAVPLCWYNELDGRGERRLEQSVSEARELMKWHAERSIPVEMNEAHHWALRDAHDVMAVAMSYIAAKNAKGCGVRHYVAQYMFNAPNALSFDMDLAKGLAEAELVDTLADDSFTVFRETRTGLPFLCADPDVAKGQLAASTYLQSFLEPDVIHVVGYSEAEHAATTDVVIESCRIVRGVLRSVVERNVCAARDERVNERKRILLNEAKYLIDFIRETYGPVGPDPLCDPLVIADCVRSGILDAPLITKKAGLYGTLRTRIIDGRCVAYDEEARHELTEEQRLEKLDPKRFSEVI